jgi:hypothetical protein
MAFKTKGISNQEGFRLIIENWNLISGKPEVTKKVTSGKPSGIPVTSKVTSGFTEAVTGNLFCIPSVTDEFTGIPAGNHAVTSGNRELLDRLDSLERSLNSKLSGLSSEIESLPAGVIKGFIQYNVFIPFMNPDKSTQFLNFKIKKDKYDELCKND